MISTYPRICKASRFSKSLLRSMCAVVAAIAILVLPASGEERKETLKRKDVPAAVKAAAKKAVPKGKITLIEREVEGEDPGQYDFEITADGKTYEVEITPEGEIKEVKEVAEGSESGEKEWTEDFQIENYTFVSRGKNLFFILEPGYQLVLESEDEKVAITVLDETEMVGGVETRVIEEREEQDGELKEVSRNYFALCKETGDVFYFGEEVDIYKNGKVVRHEGAWRADEPKSKAGIIIPGRALLGARYYQEIAPNALDRAEHVRDDVTLKTPAGVFKNCLYVEETSGLNARELCYKTYAPGVGIIQDEDLLLTKYGYVKN